MNGLEMLINSVLKSMGYSKEQFDKHVDQFRSGIIAFEKRAVDTESRIISLGDTQDAINVRIQRCENLLEQIAGKLDNAQAIHSDDVPRLAAPARANGSRKNIAKEN